MASGKAAPGRCRWRTACEAILGVRLIGLNFKDALQNLRDRAAPWNPGPDPPLPAQVREDPSERADLRAGELPGPAVRDRPAACRSRPRSAWPLGATSNAAA